MRRRGSDDSQQPQQEEAGKQFEDENQDEADLEGEEDHERDEEVGRAHAEKANPEPEEQGREEEDTMPDASEEAIPLVCRKVVTPNPCRKCSLARVGVSRCIHVQSGVPRSDR